MPYFFERRELIKGSKTPNRKKTLPIKVFDFFSGCGGSSEGFENAGLEIVCAVDNDKDAANTYKAHFTQATFYSEDILGIETGELDALVSNVPSSPCTILRMCPLSTLYEAEHPKERERKAAAERVLPLCYSLSAELTGFRKNVPGMQRLHDSRGPFPDFVRNLNKSGYQYRYGIVSCQDYGVPQKRRRLILIASRFGPIQFPKKTHGPGTPHSEYSTVRECIGDLPAIQAGEAHDEIPNHRAASLSTRNLERIAATPKGGSRKDWPPRLNLDCHSRYTGHSDVYGRMVWDKPATGLTTRCISLSNGRFGHPDQDRAISVREAACLQTFPRDFEFSGVLTPWPARSEIRISRESGRVFRSKLRGPCERIHRGYSVVAKFKTRARTVDMLGRQQIAGIPTAISELFKNAHDAYADRVEVDYYRSDKLFVLRDDGLGMTKEDFEKRWLTLGTESKLGQGGGLSTPPVDSTKKPRAILGEKGIGRLAIAAIGSQLLVLTRAKVDDVLHDTVAAFIHWGLFECPGIDLDDIEIPIRTFSDGALPDRADVAEMVTSFKGNVLKVRNHLNAGMADRILRELEAFTSVDPRGIDQYLGSPSLTGRGHGTHFILRPANDILEADIDEQNPGKTSPLIKVLIGFTNTMTPGHPDPIIKPAFRDHRSDEVADDLITEGQFFTPQEYLNADHQIQGTFDDFGQFKGSVSVYGEEFKDHVIPWRGSMGHPTLCGSFKISVASVQGAARESTIPLEDWGRLTDKMNRFGGLYVYKDNIRILPYGNNDYDWLDIERNRTKSAYYYFFSYRRMFGVVEIDQTKNSALKEKAGREGFLENRAYRQLTSILKNFFEQLAADFFREEGAYAQRFINYKAELTRLELARRKREAQVSQKKQKLSEELTRFFTDYDAGTPQQEALSLTETIAREVEAAAAINDPEQAARVLLDVESSARRRLNGLRDRYRLSRPQGVGLSKSMQKEWTDYQAAFAGLEEKVFSSTSDLIEDVVGAASKKAHLEIDRRLRIERALNELADDAKKMTKTETSETKVALERVQDEVTRALRDSITTVDTTLKLVFSDFSRLNVGGPDEEHIVRERDQLESRIIAAKEKEQQFLQYVRAQLEAVNLSEETGQFDQMEAIEERLLAMEEQADMDLQLVQLGMAIEVINHEFESSIKSIRNNLRRLKAWADVNTDLEGLYQNIRASFDHLDGYLSLFTPLHRRLYRQEVEIAGADIDKFLQDLFSERFHRHSIKLDPTRAFLRKKIVAYPSSIYPVFVNLVDNAIFWLKDQPEPRTITLDYDSDGFVISDTGPGIPERDMDAVFQLGFTRKPGGRGMGLYISREALKKIGYELVLDPFKAGCGATFRIKREKLETIEGETNG